MNVLVLMCDHHRFDALGCVGNPTALTPNLDRLASRSVRFESCYTQAPVCAPARHSLATGRYAHAHGVLGNSRKPGEELFTIAHALRPLGYRRFQIGHMHWTDPEMDTGYEPWVDEQMWRRSLPQEALARYAWEWQHITRRSTGGPGPRTVEHHWGYHVAGNAVRLMEEAVERGEPFLCWAAFFEPHPPFYPPKEFYERIDQSRIELPAQAPADAPPPHPSVARKRKEWEHLTEVEIRQILAAYYGMVALADHCIGMVLDAVERLGVAHDTLIIWTSDHGDQMWEHELFLKFVMYEGSVHVPLLISHPDIRPGVREEFVEHLDLFPTVCEMAGADIPHSVHGRSLLPLLSDGPAPDDWRTAVFSQMRDAKMIRTERWKLNVYGGEPGELFDLEKDPGEFHNRVHDPACADVAESLSARLKEWQRSRE